MATVPNQITLCDPETEGVLLPPLVSADSPVQPARSNPLPMVLNTAPDAYLSLSECQRLVDATLAHLRAAKGLTEVPRVPVSWSRSEHAHGVCKRHADHLTWEIQFSKKVFPLVAPAERANTIIHESCHVVGMLYGDHGHGPAWAECMRLCDLEPQVYAGSVEGLNAHVTCSKCGRKHGVSTGAVGQIQRGVLKVRCRDCGTELTVADLHLPEHIAKRVERSAAKRRTYACACGATYDLPAKVVRIAGDATQLGRYRCLTCRAPLTPDRVQGPGRRNPTRAEWDALDRGTEHELEHTHGIDDPEVAWETARAIAKDHLDERGDYYDRLDECMRENPRENPVRTEFDEHGNEVGRCCACGYECSTSPGASAPLNFCGDCGAIVCSACHDGTHATRCPSCAKRGTRENPPRMMEARFSGKCASCGGRIAEGERIAYDGKARHEACWRKDEEALKAKAAAMPAAAVPPPPPTGPRIYRQGDLIVADSTYAQKELVHKTGLQYNRAVPGKWALDGRWLAKTSIAELTAMLRYADASLAAEIQAILGKAVASVEGSRKAETDFRPPSPPGLEFYPYQRAGIEFALQRDATLFGDEMGLGKTNQSIGVCNSDTSVHTVVVVCPASLKTNWAREFMRWSTRAAHVRVLDSHGVTKEYGTVPADVTVDVLNYDILGKYTPPAAIDLLIVDEAHYIKNWKTQRAKGISALRPLARRVLLLTGTPLPNQPIELWNLLNTLQPGKWMKYKSFAARYNGATDGAYGGIKLGEPRNLDELQERLRREVMVRRLKSQVLTELPPKIRQVIPVQAKFKQTPELVDAVQALEDLWAAVETAAELGTAEEYAAAMAAFDGRSHVAFEEMSRYRHSLAVAKTEQVAQFVNELLEGGVSKVVVFAHHHDVEDALMVALAAFEPVMVRGGEPLELRQAAVDKFQTGSARVFVGGIMAAGVGLTLTAASHVVMAELDWVPANVKQAEDRCHRIGQKDTVNVYHLVVDGSLDIVMANALVKKMDVEDRALDKEAPKRDVNAELAVREAATLQASPVGRHEAHRVKEENLRTFTPEEIQAIGDGLVILSGLDPDFARGRNEMGWNRFDGTWGHKLAAQWKAGALSQRQANAAYRMLRKYARTQLPADVTSVLYPDMARKNPADDVPGWLR